MPLSLTRAPLPAALVSFGSFSSADFKMTTLIASQAPHQSPELMKEAIMPLSLIRASCSSAAVVFSGSLGSADSGMPMVIASCKPSGPQSSHCYLHEICVIPIQDIMALVCHGRCWCDGKCHPKPHLGHFLVCMEPLVLHSFGQLATFPASIMHIAQQ
jgi:hypothetical protein